MIKQAADLYATEQAAQQNMEQAAHFITHPTWSGVLQRGQDALETYSDTSDAGKLARLRRQIQIGREAIQEANGQPLTLDAAANVSRLSLEVAGAKEQASALEAQMKSDQRIREIGSGYGTCDGRTVERCEVNAIKVFLVMLILVSSLLTACGEPASVRAKAIQKKHGGYGHVGDANRTAP
jgi:hypothetical protein